MGFCPYCELRGKGFTTTYVCQGGNYPKSYVSDNMTKGCCRNDGIDCRYFPNESSWHYCRSCNNGVYDTERFCPTCGTQQY